MKYYKIIDCTNNEVVMINQTLLSACMAVIKGVNPFVNTRLSFNNRVFAENTVDETQFFKTFVAEIQEDFIKDFHAVVNVDYIDILQRSKHGRLNDATTERAVDNTVHEILTSDNSMNNTNVKPDLFKLTSIDLNIVMITKSGNVMAHIGDSEVILIHKSLFNKLCRKSMWCCIDKMIIDSKEVICLKGLNFNC